MGEFVEARRITPEAASTMANALFKKAGRAGLEVQLVYFRGDGDEHPPSSRDNSEFPKNGTPRRRSWHTR